MGCSFAYAHPELQLGSDSRHGNDDDVLRALALFGDDLPGNLIVGEVAFQRFHALPDSAVDQRSRENIYAMRILLI